MTEPTLGNANSGPRVATVIISEVHYDPGPATNADEFEFVEIYNRSSSPVNLTNWKRFSKRRSAKILTCWALEPGNLPLARFATSSWASVSSSPTGSS